MRLIYVADVHGAFERVRQLLYETEADVYIIAGDLVDISFHTGMTACRYHDLQTYFHGIRRGKGKAAMVLEDFVDELLEDPQLPGEMMEKGTRYRRETLHARRVLRQNYRLLENMISLERQGHIFCLPGNHDMDLRHTALRNRDLHLSCREAGPFRIAGYGGASGQTPGIPERYVVPYRAGAGINEETNEMYRFFKETRPHIVVSHQPAYGIHDFASPMGETGSIALRKYCEKYSVLLCLTGHLHDQWGMEEEDGTVYLNPSHFGKIMLSGGRLAEGGFFYEVEVENGRVKRITHRKLVQGAIHDVVVHDREDQRWEQTIVHRGRFEALLTGRNYESGTERKSSVSDDSETDLHRLYELFQRSRIGETTATIESSVRLLEGELPHNLAVDLMSGSGNGEKGDERLDIVLYLRCGCADHIPCLSEKEAACPLYCQAREKIEEILGEKVTFDIVDCIDLDRVERSIRDQDYECQITQRFISYRSMCRIVNEPLIAPVENLLAANEEYRREVEGNIASYFSVLMNTIRHVRSFQTYESRLKALGMTIPEPISRKLRAYLADESRE
ncbi:MAG: metallophosphoesterase [Deltaproteobacteria bacterium]|nr:metallophosphoesterase [Deltaproteobacteria bacterium]